MASSREQRPTGFRPGDPLFEAVVDMGSVGPARTGVTSIGSGQVSSPKDFLWPGLPAPDERAEGGGGQPSKVLVPFNGTDVARTAIDVAANLSRGRSAMVWILYVRPWHVSRGTGRFTLETMDEARGCAQAAVTDLRQRGVSASAIVRDARREKVALAIAAEAERLRVSCIVLGTHARGPLTSALVGSTSLSVARQATRPIILVKSPNRRRRPLFRARRSRHSHEED